MRKNDHIGALVRINALQIANGDYLKAEEILKWAYGPFVIDDEKKDETPKRMNKTEAFIEKYLAVRDGIRKSEARQFIKQYVLNPDKSLDYDLIRDHINDMEYKDFLSTVYWKGISLAVKERDGNVCQICGGTTRLNAHHLHYLNHGDELHHLDDLKCVCRSCHEKSHGIKNEETNEFREIKSIEDLPDAFSARPYRRKPKTGSALSLKDIITEQKK